MSYQLSVRHSLASLVIGCLALGLANCSKKEDQATKGQVIAHLGKDDVSIHELDHEFRSDNIPVDKRSDEVVGRVLNDIIQRKLLVQQAVAAKLDREPTVLLDISRSRERILAAAYLQREVANKAAAIGKSDIDNYIASHPGKFAKRMALIGEQITFQLNASAQSVVTAAKDAKTLEDIDKILSELGVLHSRSMATMNSADVPDEVMKVMEAKKSDDIFFFRAGSNGVFFKLKAIEGRPPVEDEAEKLARQALMIDMFKEESKKTESSALSQARFEGDYARIMSQRDQPKDGATKPAETK